MNLSRKKTRVSPRDIHKCFSARDSHYYHYINLYMTGTRVLWSRRVHMLDRESPCARGIVSRGLGTVNNGAFARGLSIVSTDLDWGKGRVTGTVRESDAFGASFRRLGWFWRQVRSLGHTDLLIGTYRFGGQFHRLFRSIRRHVWTVSTVERVWRPSWSQGGVL